MGRIHSCGGVLIGSFYRIGSFSLSSSLHPIFPKITNLLGLFLLQVWSLCSRLSLLFHLLSCQKVYPFGGISLFVTMNNTTEVCKIHLIFCVSSLGIHYSRVCKASLDEEVWTYSRALLGYVCVLPSKLLVFDLASFSFGTRVTQFDVRWGYYLAIPSKLDAMMACHCISDMILNLKTTNADNKKKNLPSLIWTSCLQFYVISKQLERSGLRHLITNLKRFSKLFCFLNRCIAGCVMPQEITFLAR